MFLLKKFPFLQATVNHFIYVCIYTFRCDVMHVSVFACVCMRACVMYDCAILCRFDFRPQFMHMMKNYWNLSNLFSGETMMAFWFNMRSIRWHSKIDWHTKKNSFNSQWMNDSAGKIWFERIYVHTEILREYFSFMRHYVKYNIVKFE